LSKTGGVAPYWDLLKPKTRGYNNIFRKQKKETKWLLCSKNNSCKLILENLLASLKRYRSVPEDIVIAHRPNCPRHAD